jgi:hypothetical protein
LGQIKDENGVLPKTAKFSAISIAWRRTRRFAISRDRICEIGIVIGGTGFGPDVDDTIRAESYIANHHGVRR